MKARKLLFGFLSFLMFIPVVSAGKTKVTDYKTNLQDADNVMDYTNEKQGIEKDSRMTTMTWKGNTYYCTSPGTEAAATGSSADCVGETLSDTAAAPYLSIFNSGESKQEIAYATRLYSANDYITDYSSVGMQSNGCAYMKMAKEEGVTLNDYTLGYIKKNCKDVDIDVTGDKDISKIIKDAKDKEAEAVKKANQGANAEKKFSVKQSKDTYRYSNAVNVQVTLDCAYCRFKGVGGTTTTINGNGNLVVELDPNIECEGDDDYIITFETEPDEGGGEDPDDTPEDDGKEQCIEVTRITCSMGGTPLQSFIGCSKKGKNTNKKKEEKKDKDETENPDGGGDGGNEFSGTLECNNDDCENVTYCPESETFIDEHDNVEGDGNIYDLCDYTKRNYEVTMISEATYYEENPDYVECCVLEGEQSKKHIKRY